MNTSTSSNIKRTALNNHVSGGLGLNELNKLAKQFIKLTDQELQTERDTIEQELCKFSSESVFFYRLAIVLYDRVVAERIKSSIIKQK